MALEVDISNCPECGKAVGKTYNFCANCGWDLSMIIEEVDYIIHELKLNDFYKSLSNIRIDVK